MSEEMFCVTVIYWRHEDGVGLVQDGGGGGAATHCSQTMLSPNFNVCSNLQDYFGLYRAFIRMTFKLG